MTNLVQKLHLAILMLKTGPMNNFQTFHSEIDVMHVLSVCQWDATVIQKGYGHPEDSWDVLE